MGARARLAWMVKGGPATSTALDVLGNDLRELQQKVALLTSALDDLRTSQTQLDERQLDEFDAIRDAVAAATDDLVLRVNAIDERTRSTT